MLFIAHEAVTFSSAGIDGQFLHGSYGPTRSMLGLWQKINTYLLTAAELCSADTNVQGGAIYCSQADGGQTSQEELYAFVDKGL